MSTDALGTDSERVSEDEEEDRRPPYVVIDLPQQSRDSIDILTEQPEFHYMYKTDALSEADKAWFQKNIKLEQFTGTDEPDISALNFPQQGVNRQVSSNSLNQAGIGSYKVPTDAFGQLQFIGEDLVSWYVRIAIRTESTSLQQLMMEKLQVVESNCNTLQIHCIDYEELPGSFEKYQPKKTVKRTSVGITRQQSSVYDLETLQSRDISDRLRKDIRSICKRTGGLVITWSGLQDGPGSILHRALKQLHADFREGNSFQSSIAAVACPPWTAFPSDVQETFKTQGAKVVMSPRDEIRRETWGAVSPYASHYLQLDTAHLEAREFRRHYRHFQCRLLKAMGSKEEKSQTPVVCLLFNGGQDALKMVHFALQNDIPLIVVKGSGGYADVIADVYMMAEVEVRKEREPGTGKVVTKAFKLKGKAGDHYMRNKITSNPLLKEVFKQLNKLTVYDPAVSVQSLDAVIFEALLKNGEEHKINYLMQVMKKLKSSYTRTVSESSPSFIDSENVQMNFFIEALKQNSKDVVKSFLSTLQISFDQFHMGRVLRLYTKDTNKRVRLVKVRMEMQNSLKKLARFPLRCRGRKCARCDVETHSKSKEDELERQRTCLHPMQELFLWCLHAQMIELAVVFWAKCDDKIAAALFARSLLKSRAKTQTDPDVRWQMTEDANRFQELAILTLKSCQEMDEILTEWLLTKPCEWWGGVSVLQLAIMTSNRPFIAQTACKNILTRIWKGQPFSNKNSSKQASRSRFVAVTEEEPLLRCSSSICCQTPRRSYAFSLVLQVIFLILFSYVLLFDFGRNITPCFIALIVWVLDIAAEEGRQMLASDPVINEGQTSFQENHWRKRRCRSYWQKTWNQLDVATVVVFMLGMLVFVDHEAVHITGRILLSVDIFLFFIRTFQMLMVFEELGLMLVMAGKMVKDTVNFMIILLVVVLAYAVMSEAVLYPESDLTFARLFHVPRKAYWQVFGEVGLEEMELNDEDSCSVANDSKHFGGNIPHCPSHYGRYVASVMLAVYIMITNVLLLNLLIARFNKTFDKVHDDAREYQSWHRCEIITEFYHRSTLIPPLNMIKAAIKLCRYTCSRVWYTCKHCCRTMCQKRENGMRCCGKACWKREEGTATEKKHLAPKVSATRSPDGRTIEVTWQASDLEKDDRSKDEDGFTVKLSAYDENMESVYGEEHKLAANTICDCQAFTFWDLKPSWTYAITVDGVEVNLMHSWDCLLFSSDDLAHIQKFESKQASWTSRPEKMGETMFREEVMKVTSKLMEENRDFGKKLQETTDDVKAELTHVGNAVMKVSHCLEENLDRATKERKKNMRNIQQISNYIENHVMPNIAKLNAQLKKQDERISIFSVDRNLLQKSLEGSKKEVEFLKDKLEALNIQKTATEQEAQEKVRSLQSEITKLKKQLESSRQKEEEARGWAAVTGAEKATAEPQCSSTENHEDL